MSGAIERTDAQQVDIFNRVLVGVDGSDESREAARQAAILVDGKLTLVASYDVAPAIAGTGVGVAPYLDEDVQRAAATDALERVREHPAVGMAAGKVVFGRAADALISEVEREQVTLLVVGSHGLGRVAGFVLGSTANEVIRKLPCSVLIARRRSEADEFPNKVVVGVDGSRESSAAYAVARRLSARFDVKLWPVVAHGGKAVDRRLIDPIIEGQREELQDEPVAALVAAAAGADLLVVGSRGLHGLKALGSVSERVAQQAGSSVLIVREPASTGGG